MTSTTLAAGHGTTYGPIIVTIGVVFIVGAVIAVVVASYFRLQGHRADAVAMASSWAFTPASAAAESASAEETIAFDAVTSACA